MSLRPNPRHFKTIVFPILVPIIAHLSQNHWHKLIQDSLTALRNIIRDIDVQLYERYANDNSSKYLYLIRTPKALKEQRELVERKWDFLAEKALANNPSFKVPTVPYKDSHIVGKHNGLDNGAILFID